MTWTDLGPSADMGTFLRTISVVTPTGTSADAANIQAALTAMAAVGGKVVLKAGSYTLTDNVTGTSGVAVDIMPGASIAISAAKTLTLAGACNILGATNPFSGAGAVSLAVPSSGALSRRLTWSLATGGDTLYLTSTTDAEVLAVDAKAGTTVDIQTWRVGGTVVGDITATGAIEIKAISFQHDLTGPNLGGGNGVIAETFGGSLSIASGDQSNGNIVLTAYDGGSVHGAIYFKAGAGADTKMILDGTHGYFKNNYRFGWATSSGGAGGGAVQDVFWLSAADEVIIGGGLSTTGGKLMTAGAGATCLQWGVSGTNIGFLGAAPVARQTVSGSRASGAALTSLLTALANLGLITDSTSA